MPSARILVVDDEPDISNAWRKALKMGGHSVIAVNTADEALQVCEENSFDIIIIDFIMPTMTGIELLNKIRKKQPLVRSVVVSGKLDSDHKEDVIGASLKDSVETDLFLHKPVSNDRLLKVIDEMLSTAQVGADWKAVAKRVVDANNSTEKAAREASRKLKTFSKKKKPK